MKTNIHQACVVLEEVFKDFSLLQKTGTNPPKYQAPENNRDFLEHLKKISTVFNKDMTFNIESPYAEEYALCLMASKRETESLELFELITQGRESDLILLHDPLANGCYYSEEVSPTKGKLGYISILQYAKLLLKKNDTRGAKLLIEIIEKIPAKCSPISLQDTRVSAIKMLQYRGITWLDKKPISEVLSEAERYQY